MDAGKVSPLKISVVRFIIFAGLTMILFNLFFMLYRGVSTYKSQLETETYEIDTLTKTVSEHIELSLLAVDVVLKRGVEKHYFNHLFGKNLGQNTQNNIIAWVDETPQISAMLMADKNGDINAIYRKAGYKHWMEGKESVKGEPFFAFQEDNFEKLHVSKHQSFIKEQKGFIALSRRLEKIDGSFDGIILAVVDVNEIDDFFKSIQPKRNTKLVLSHNISQERLIDPRVISNGVEGLSYRKTEKSYQDLKNNSDTEEQVVIFDNDAVFPGNLRVYSFYDIPNLKLTTSLLVYGSDALQDWTDGRISDLIIFIIFILFVFIVSFFSIELAKKVQKLRISERSALAASKTKSDFLANMSHELRTPLNAIIGFSEMLTSEYFGKVNSKQRERLDDINSCGNHLLSLINDILEFSKGQAGKLEIRAEEVAIRKVVKEAVRMFEERASSEGISIITNVSKEMPHLMIDRRKIKQVLINLLSNSVKFCEHGDVIEINESISDDGEYVLVVKDTGAGMRKEDIPKALSAFGQVSGGQAVGGTGLGLPICKLFIDLHNGKLDIDSDVGKGTTVKVMLPKKVFVSTSDS